MKKITIIAVVLVVVGGLIWFFTKSPSGPTGPQVSKLDVIDTVENFYDQWLKAVKQPTVDPSRAILAKSPILSKALSARLVIVSAQASTTPDPVLCQTVIPENISTRSVFENKDKAQALVTSRDKKATNQAIVTLTKLNESWYIDNIECSLGEFEAKREFSFEKEGFLLKGSVPKPYDSKNWHLVFEDNGKLGNVVPLFFDATSQCTSLDGKKSVCKPDQFTETTKVFVHGQMTERGVSIKRLEFVK